MSERKIARSGLKPATDKQIENVPAPVRRQSGQTLMDTGQLATSITSEATSQGVTIRTNKAYGAIHHFGVQAGRNKKVTLPARPFLVVQEYAYEQVHMAWGDELR